MDGMRLIRRYQKVVKSELETWKSWALNLVQPESNLVEMEELSSLRIALHLTVVWMIFYSTTLLKI